MGVTPIKLLVVYIIKALQRLRNIRGLNEIQEDLMIMKYMYMYFVIQHQKNVILFDHI